MLPNFFGRRNAPKPIVAPIDFQSCFVGREDVIGAFSGYCAGESERLRVLVVHGAPGLGKSALLRRLRDNLAELAPGALDASFDFTTLRDTTQAWREVLATLRDDLALKEMRLPSFDLLLGFTLAGEGDAVLEPLLSSSLLECVRFGGAALIIYAENPGALPKFLEEAIARGAELFPEVALLQQAPGDLATDIARLCQLVQSRDAALPSLLIQAFSDDLDKALPAADGLRGALFLDAHECLWDDRHTGASPTERQLDWWLRELAANCLMIGVLPVIFGREPLLWPSEDADWTHDDLEQHALHGLSFNSAHEFLTRCGIGAQTDASANAALALEENDALLPSRNEANPSSVRHPLQAAIVHCCAGMELANRAVFARSVAGTLEDTQYSSEPDCHPLWLALCAAIVHNGRAAGKGDPAPAHFARISPEHAASRLTDWYLRSLDNRALERTLLKLSITPRFDEAVAQVQAEDALGEEFSQYWQGFKQLFFMQSEAPRGESGVEFVRMHPLVRRELLARVRHEEVLEEHLNLAHYWGGRGESALEWFHLWCIDADNSLARWRTRHHAALESDIREARALLAVWRDVPLDQQEHERLGAAQWSRTHQTIAQALMETPSPSPTTTLALAADHLQNAHHGFIQPEFAAQRSQVQKQLQLARHHLLFAEGEAALGLNNPQRARDVWSEALPFFTPEVYPDEWRQLQVGLGYAYRDLAQSEAPRDFRDPRGFGDTSYAKAIFHFEAALHLLTAQNDLPTWGAVQRELALLYKTSPTEAKIENLRRAIAYFNHALSYYTQNDHAEIWGETQRLLGDCYMEFRVDDRPLTLRYAAGCYQAALCFYDENYPDERARLFYDLGLTWGEFGDVGDNINAFISALDAFRAAVVLFHAQGNAEEAAKTEAIIVELNEALGRLGVDVVTLPAPMEASELHEAPAESATETIAATRHEAAQEEKDANDALTEELNAALERLSAEE